MSAVFNREEGKMIDSGHITEISCSASLAAAQETEGATG
jgi:hypothetical protein